MRHRVVGNFGRSHAGDCKVRRKNIDLRRHLMPNPSFIIWRLSSSKPPGQPHAHRVEWPDRRGDPVSPFSAFRCLVLNVKRQQAVASLHFHSETLEYISATIR